VIPCRKVLEDYDRPQEGQMETQPHLLGPSRLLEGGDPSPLTPLHQTMSFACFNSLNPHKALSPLQMGKLRHSTFLHTHTSTDQVLGVPWYLPANSTPLRGCVQWFRPPKCSMTPTLLQTLSTPSEGSGRSAAGDPD